MSREAMQMALEALVQWEDEAPHAWSKADEAAVAALRAALAEPEQEPVAWRITDGEGDWEYRTDLPEDWSIQWSARYGRKYEPLYTAPTPRRPLTDEEILAEMPVAGHRPITSFARAIEAKLKEKNNGS